MVAAAATSVTEVLGAARLPGLDSLSGVEAGVLAADIPPATSTSLPPAPPSVVLASLVVRPIDLVDADAPASDSSPGVAPTEPTRVWRVEDEGDLFGDAEAEEAEGAGDASPVPTGGQPTTGPQESEAFGSSQGAPELRRGGSGRRIGSQRAPPSAYYPEGEAVGNLYRHAVWELLGAPSVSSRSGHGPTGDDQLFHGRVVALERLRSRPNSRGGPARSVPPQNLPSSLEELDVVETNSRGWDVIPRGSVSEWFPFGPDLSDTEACAACSASVRVEEIRCYRRGVRSAAFARRDRRIVGSSSGLGDWAGGGRLLMQYPLAHHSCGCGHPLSLPATMFTPTGRPQIVEDPEEFGVRLRLTLHLLVPSFPISWVSEGSLDCVFPLFGGLRRYWGRAVGVRGRFMLDGRPFSSRRNPEVRHRLTLSARVRRPLRYAAMEVVTTVAYGPRHDVFLFGAALQWVDGAVQDGVMGGLRLPRRTTRHSLRQRLYRRCSPHSFLFLQGETWVVDPPSRDVGEFGGEGPAGPGELGSEDEGEEESEAGDGNNRAV